MGIHAGLLLIVAALGLALYFTRASVHTYTQDPPKTPVKTTPKPTAISISVTPTTVIQGEPVLLTVEGLSDISKIASFTYDGKPLWIFPYNSKPSSLIGLDLRLEPRSYPLVLTLKDGKVIQSKLVVGKREVHVETFGIPDKLGGNTSESEKALVNSLIAEANIINSLPTADTFLWSGKFIMPLKGNVTILDPYGYTRQTGGSQLSHKGTDMRAAIGTPVYAMNDGVVVYNGFLRNYGNVIVLDHGHSLQTIYMHLSKSLVTVNQAVKKGDEIGKSGDTGYVLGPHLHLSIKIGKVSIDPMKFMEIFGN
jgi:hypothetical protein